MAEHIPFVNSDTDCEILEKYYADSDIIRVSLESLHKLQSRIPDGSKLWVDPAVDAYHHILSKNDWPVDILNLTESQIRKQWPVHSSGDKKGERKDQSNYRKWQRWYGCFGGFNNHQLLATPEKWGKSYHVKLNEFVVNVLNRCLEYGPQWITVPQLPIVDSGQRNRINKLLASAAAQWRRKEKFGGMLVFPVLFTNHSQLKNKSTQDVKIRTIIESYKTSNAEAIWVVDTSLPSQPDSEKCRKKYSDLIKFHMSLKDHVGTQTIIISGPYWGINLVLWARGLSHYPAISLGSRYTYYFPCGFGLSPSKRISLPPLRRWVIVNRDLGVWLNKAMNKLDPGDVVYQELFQIEKTLGLLSTGNGSVNQTARFYKQWFDKISEVPPRGRNMALYQDLSSAFVAGSQLPPIPKSCEPYCTKEMRVPGKVAEQLMLNCF